MTGFDIALLAIFVRFDALSLSQTEEYTGEREREKENERVQNVDCFYRLTSHIFSPFLPF